MVRRGVYGDEAPRCVQHGDGEKTRWGESDQPTLTSSGGDTLIRRKTRFSDPQ